jgi:hypothetical protein
MTDKLDKDGMNSLDPALVDVNETSEIEARRAEVAQQIPEYPREWQEGYSDDNEKGFEDPAKLKLNVSLKEAEMKKIIKKYKRYMKSNITEVKRLES